MSKRPPLQSITQFLYLQVRDIWNCVNSFNSLFNQSIWQGRLVAPRKQLFLVCFLQNMWKFGIFDKFLCFNAVKNLETLRDVFGYSKYIFSWENISKYAKSGCFSKECDYFMMMLFMNSDLLPDDFVKYPALLYSILKINLYLSNIFWLYQKRVRNAQFQRSSYSKLQIWIWDTQRIVQKLELRMMLT